MVPSGPDLVASIFSEDNWHVPFPRAEILDGKMRSKLLCCELRSPLTYPNANVLHSESPRQMFRHLSSTFVSVRLKVLSNGSIAPKAIRSKQSESRKQRKSAEMWIAQHGNRDYVTRNQLFGVNSSKNILRIANKATNLRCLILGGFFPS